MQKKTCFAVAVLLTTLVYIHLRIFLPLNSDSLTWFRARCDKMNICDIETEENQLHSKKQIFFIVSTLFNDGVPHLTSRQSCAIESAASTNPDWKVIVLFVNITKFEAITSQTTNALAALPNVSFRRLNLGSFGSGSPLEHLLQGDALKHSSFIVEHTSDLLRVLTLYKYGGIYLDTDVVVMKSLNQLPHNFVVLQNELEVSNGVLRFEVGHQFADDCLRELADNFDGTQWASNGPTLVTRILRKYCNLTEQSLTEQNGCPGDLSILAPEMFYKIPYMEHERFFKEDDRDDVLKLLRGKVLAHIWNKMNHGIRLKSNAHVAYIALAERFCPRTLALSGEYF